jgi:DDE superfamily endonuclease
MHRDGQAAKLLLGYLHRRSGKLPTRTGSASETPAQIWQHKLAKAGQALGEDITRAMPRIAADTMRFSQRRRTGQCHARRPARAHLVRFRSAVRPPPFDRNQENTRKLSCYRQALFGLAWFRNRGSVPRPGAGFGLAQATAYRYLGEVIAVLAAQAPGLREALEHALADGGYGGAGHGVLTRVKKPAGMKELDINARTRNALIRSLRCMGERGLALLSQRWQTLQHVTMSRGKIGRIARAALVLVLFEHKMIS